MGRPLRVQEPYATYHITAQGNRSSALFLDAYDRQAFMNMLRLTADRHEWHCHAWCLMTTHYHLLVTTPHADLAAGMHRLNSRYAHWSNAVYSEVGHVFRARYGAKLVETDEHLFSCYRYIARNPVTAGMCERPGDWRWSSYTILMSGARVTLPSSETHLLSHFADARSPRGALQRLVEAAAEPDTSGAWHQTGLRATTGPRCRSRGTSGPRPLR